MRFESRNTSRKPDIEFTADVRARELRFEEVPNPKVRFPGRHGRESDWHSERENLPDEVREGVVYRDAGVRVLIASETVGSDSGFSRSSDKEGTNLEDRGPEAEEQETESNEEEK